MQVTHQSLAQRASKALLLFMVMSLSACVTIVEGPFNKKASPQKAVENYTQLGLGYLQQGRTDWARQRLNRALQINEDDAPANDAMGLVWQAEGELDLAEESFKKALSSDSDFTLARHHLGRLYAQMKRYRPARNYLEEAVEDRYYDNRAAAYNDLALNEYRSGDTPAAMAGYRQALRLMPYNVDALVNLSTLLFEQQNYSESRKYFDRFDRLVEREQTRHTAHSLWLGIKLANLKPDTQRAIKFAKALKQNFSESEEYRLYRESLSDAETVRLPRKSS